MGFSPDFLEELRGRLSLADIIARKVKLIRRGRELVGLCPFHNEKSPSFTVSEEKGFFYCFGCGAHGDAVTFVMRSEGLGFLEAIERLAEQAGLAVPQSSPVERERAQRQATLLGALDAAAAWFERQLVAPGGRGGLDYLRRRGLADGTIARFRLGFAPDNRGALKAALIDAGFPEPLLLEAGLLGRPEGGGQSYDRFRGRVMFPITDRRGRVIAFGGRTMGDGQPKYLNSPETPVFHKGRVLYGLAPAMGAARESGEIVVVEGYMDVIALSQAGLQHVVAPLGTALTEDQIALLWQIAAEPILCFDGDAAGQRAAARAADRALPLLQPGKSLRFALLPAGDDPDSLVGRLGPAAMRELLGQARPLVSLLWEQETVGRAFDTPERRAGLRRRLQERVAAIADREVQQLYRSDIDQRLEAAFGAPRRSWRGRAGTGRPGGGRAGFGGGFGSGSGPGFGPGSGGRPGLRDGGAWQVGGGEAARRGTVGMAQQREAVLLAILLRHPDLLHDHGEAVAHVALGSADLDKVRRAIIDLAAGHPDLDSGSLTNYLIEKGFARVVETVFARTAVNGFAAPAADRATAALGLAHILGLLEEQEARREADIAERELAENPTGENLARFEAKRQLVESGESRRRDIDEVDLATARTRQ
ncbi:MAG: DNA primase [Dongiaceae bacterium]